MTRKNSLNWLHISDIHFHQNKEWRDSAVHKSFISYLNEIFASGVSKPDLIFCTGDIAFGDTKFSPMSGQYEAAAIFFKQLLEVCGSENSPLPPGRLYIVPGNHDVNRSAINSDAQSTLTAWAVSARDHVQKINQRFNDKTREFADTILRLSEYQQFVSTQLPHQADQQGRAFYAHNVDCNGLTVAVCGFNSAWTCAGPEDDRNIWMAADWQFNQAGNVTSQAAIRIALMHHPVDWLNVADREIVKRRLTGEFDFFLHGHAHDSWVEPNANCITISAGAVAADQSDEFGFNIVSLNLAEGTGSVSLHTKATKTNDWIMQPVPQHAPDGKWRVNLPPRLIEIGRKTDSGMNAATKTTIKSAGTANVLVARYLKKRLDDARLSFGAHCSDWIEPVLSTANERAQNAASAEKVNVNELIATPGNTSISAPPQYGLTCLAHYMVHQSWDRHSKFWLYLDATSLKPNNASIEKAVDDELQVVGIDRESISAVVIDSWSDREKDDVKLLRLVCEAFNGIPVICMRQAETAVLAGHTGSLVSNREFRDLHLWALSREQIRKMVSSYNNKRPIGEEDVVTTRLIKAALEPAELLHT